MTPEPNLSVRVHDLEHGHREVRTDVNEIQAHLYGNGKPGLLTLVDRLQQKDMGHSKSVVLICTIVAAVISAMGGIIAAQVAK